MEGRQQGALPQQRLLHQSLLRSAGKAGQVAAVLPAGGLSVRPRHAAGVQHVAAAAVPGWQRDGPLGAGHCEGGGEAEPVCQWPVLTHLTADMQRCADALQHPGSRPFSAAVLS